MLSQKLYCKSYLIAYDEEETGFFCLSECPSEIILCYKWVAGVAVLSSKVSGVHSASAQYHDTLKASCNSALLYVETI